PGLHKQRRLAVAYLAYSPPSRILVTEVLSNFRYEEALHQRAFQRREQARWAEQVLLRREALHELVEQGRLGRLPIAVAHLGFVMCFHERLPSCRPPRSTYTTFLTHPVLLVTRCTYRPAAIFHPEMARLKPTRRT